MKSLMGFKRILALLAMGAASLGMQARAGVITILEPSDAPPDASTNLEAGVITTGLEFASVSGLIRPATSPSPLAPGVTYATLVEPLNSPEGPGISDIIRLTASVQGTDALGLFQRITVEFFSDQYPGFSNIIPPTLVPPSIVETGAPQDITALLGINFPQQNVQVIVSSDVAPAEGVPEPSTLAGAGLAVVAGLAALRRRKTRRAVQAPTR